MYGIRRKEITLPANGWRPRKHQLPFWNSFAAGIDGESGGALRLLEVAHRRWGKDEVALHGAAVAAHQRIADYWHCLPKYSQARKAIWQATNPHTGRRRIDEAFPAELRANVNEQEMYIRLKCGSSWRVVGSDNPDSLVGAPPAGLVFSEWALANPSAWAFLAPIVEENNGWAMFITTPRGRNHCHSMHEMAKKSPRWFAEICDVHKSGYSLERVENARAEYHSIFGPDQGDALIEQEYFCSFDAAILGSYWGKPLSDALRAGRIRRVIPQAGFPVHRAWDLGIGDSTAIWFFQIIGREIHVLGYYESHGIGIDQYAIQIKKQLELYRNEARTAALKAGNSSLEKLHTLLRVMNGGTDFVPHDATARELGNKGKTRVEAMIEEELDPDVVLLHRVEDGINAARRILPICYFDELGCQRGLENLRHYRAEWNDKKKTFTDRPEHDFSSHAADAFRYLAMAYEEQIAAPKPVKEKHFEIGADDRVNEVTIDDLWALRDGESENVLGYS